MMDNALNYLPVPNNGLHDGMVLQYLRTVGAPIGGLQSNGSDAPFRIPDALRSGRPDGDHKNSRL
jgi:hypothetical protein